MQKATVAFAAPLLSKSYDCRTRQPGLTALDLTQKIRTPGCTKLFSQTWNQDAESDCD